MAIEPTCSLPPVSAPQVLRRASEAVPAHLLWCASRRRDPPASSSGRSRARRWGAGSWPAKVRSPAFPLHHTPPGFKRSPWRPFVKASKASCSSNSSSGLPALGPAVDFYRVYKLMSAHRLMTQGPFGNSRVSHALGHEDAGPGSHTSKAPSGAIRSEARPVHGLEARQTETICWNPVRVPLWPRLEARNHHSEASCFQLYHKNPHLGASVCGGGPGPCGLTVCGGGPGPCGLSVCGGGPIVEGGPKGRPMTPAQR